MPFRLGHIIKILRGEKIQRRRLGNGLYQVSCIYPIQQDWTHTTGVEIFITRRYFQGLGDISSQEIGKEDYGSLVEFKRAWIFINGFWNPALAVTVYEFKLLNGEAVNTVEGATRNEEACHHRNRSRLLGNRPKNGQISVRFASRR